jgi:hypothetical protein
VGGWTVPAPEGRNAVRDRTRWVLCVPGRVPGEASEPVRTGPRAIQRDSRNLLGKCGWVRSPLSMAQACQAGGQIDAPR